MRGAVLGLNLGHDRSACLVVDGEIRSAIAEERLSRRKHDLPLNSAGERYNHLPERAVEYCLSAVGLDVADLDVVVASTTYVLNVESGLRRQLAEVDIRNRMPGLTCSVTVSNHHLAHAASAVAGVDADRCAVLIVDGGGSIVTENALGGREFERSSLFLYQDHDFRLRARSTGQRPLYGNSIGDFFQLVTQYLGFRAGEEGKTMALAGYGRRGKRFEPLSPFRDAIVVSEDCRHVVRDIFQYDADGGFSPALLKLYGAPRSDHGLYGDLEFALAASAQWALEEALLALAKRGYVLCGGLDTLCLAGGVYLNCVANGRIVRESPFGRVFVQPAASDDGTALGNAVLGWRHLAGKDATLPRFTSAYLGRAYAYEEITVALKEHRGQIAVSCPADIIGEIVADVLDGAIVAVFRGGSEFGPRALGHRSILCDPRSTEIRDRLNADVKHRERFRPFAPMTTVDAAGDYFAHGSGNAYMMLAGAVLQPDILPGITHVDGTSRVQTVSKGSEPFLYQLLEIFGSRSGVPVLLNTSFNDQEPIVESPDGALACFLRTGIDVLYLESFRVVRA